MALKRLWVPLAAALVGALTAVTLAGLLGARQTALAEPRALVSRTIMVPAGAFNPADDGIQFVNTGDALTVNYPGSGMFHAPLFFEAKSVTIKKLTLYAWDNEDGHGTCVLLYRTSPTAGSEIMGQVCSTGAAQGTREFTESDLAIRTINGGYAPFLRLHVGTGSLHFYMVKITYSYTAGT